MINLNSHEHVNKLQNFNGFKCTTSGCSAKEYILERQLKKKVNAIMEFRLKIFMSSTLNEKAQIKFMKIIDEKKLYFSNKIEFANKEQLDQCFDFIEEGENEKVFNLLKNIKCKKQK